MENGLKKHWSPEQFSGWLKKNYPDNPAMNMCAETIYQAIYVHARGQLKLEVEKCCVQDGAGVNHINNPTSAHPILKTL